MADVFDMKKGAAFSKGPKLAIMAAIAFGVIVLLSASFETVGPGHKGVVFSRFGGIQDHVLGEGLQFKIPFVEFIIPIDVRIQKAQTDSTASSKDLQTVSSTIAVNYHVDPDKVNTIYQEIGTQYKVRVIDPAVQESVKAATAQFTAEELIGKREAVKEVIKENLTIRLAKFNILVDEFNIIDFQFSRKFNEAIELKVEAEQTKLKAEMDLERIKVEADQIRTRAKAEADAQELQNRTVTAKILQLRAIEKWDGHFPQVVGGAMPFIDVTNLTPKKR